MDSKGSKENNLIYIYTIVEAQSVVDLVRLTNLKTKKGWKCLGGMCFISLHGTEYPFCQSMYRMDKAEEKKVDKKRFTAFPYKGSDFPVLPEESKPATQKITKRKSFKFVTHPLKKEKHNG